MKITAIKQQVKRADRYSIYVDGKYEFSLSDSALLSSGLVPNQEISLAELAKLKQASNIDKAYNQALNLVARRPRSEWELSVYLKNKGYEKTEQETVLDRLRAAGFSDDLDFARRWVASRRLLKPISRRRLVSELKAKRLKEEIIKTVMAEDEIDDRETLRELIERKRRVVKYQDKLKLMQYLSRQGYDYQDIKSALEEDDA